MDIGFSGGNQLGYNKWERRKNAMLDLKRFFDNGVDFRSPSSLLPPFSGNKVAGFFPDATFDSVVLQPDLNADVNNDGIPDIVQ